LTRRNNKEIPKWLPDLTRSLFRQTSLGPAVPETYRRLADLNPSRLAADVAAEWATDMDSQPY
jgi:hypothetical protein